jgi:hypothetical protein
MTWHAVRLELARTPDFPEGSAAHGYLLHLPIGERGMIDEEERSRAPERAVVHRFWAGEADVNGYVVRTPGGWAFSYRPGEEDDEALFRLDRHAFRVGEYLSLTQPDGDGLPFRVVRVQPLPAAVSTAARFP